MDKKSVIDEIISKEWMFFQEVENIGGRACCQDDWKTFYIMRQSQFGPWEDAVLESWLNDLAAAGLRGENPIEQKYAYMMQYDYPEYYKNEIEPYIPGISAGKKELIGNIKMLLDSWYKEASEYFPNVSSKGRPGKGGQTGGMVSVDHYLLGELCTYSMDTLGKYNDMIKRMHEDGRNMVIEIYENTALAYGYNSLEQAEDMHGTVRLGS